jgi:hypothetical protein
MSDGPMWRFLKWRIVIKEGDFSPRHTGNSDEVSHEGSQDSDKTDTKRSVFTLTAVY